MKLIVETDTGHLVLGLSQKFKTVGAGPSFDYDTTVHHPGRRFIIPGSDFTAVMKIATVNFVAGIYTLRSTDLTPTEKDDQADAEAAVLIADPVSAVLAKAAGLTVAQFKTDLAAEIRLGL